MAQNGYKFRIGTYYAAEYAASSAWNGFVTLFYAARGMSVGQVSLLMTAGPLVALAALPLCGALADRTRLKNTVHRLLFALCAGSSLLFLRAQGFWLLLAATALFSFFSTCIAPMGETVTLAYLHKEGLPFGRLRMAGTVSYALCSYAFGALLDGSIDRFIPLVCASFALGGLCSLLLPAVPGEAQKKRPRFLSLLKKKDLRTLLSFALCLQAVQGVFYTLYGLLMTQTLGGTRADVGLGTLVGTLAEIPFLLFADKLLRRFGAPRLLLASAVGLGARFLVMGLFPSRAVAIASQALCVCGIIVCAFTMAQYVSLSVPQASAASGQMLLYVVTYALARALGSLISFGLSRFFSLPAAFLCCAALCALALAAFARRLWRAPGLPNIQKS